MKHIIVLGAGFGGLECTKKLCESNDVRVTLIDRQNHHLFQPLLYQVASAGLAATEIAHPIRSVFSEAPNVNVLMEEVTTIDIENKRVTTNRSELDYDYLVIGLGVKTGYFGNDHWAEHTIGLKTIDDAKKIRRQFLIALERAEACEDEVLREKLMNIAIVGGGPTGVELAGAFAELAKRVVRRDFHRIDTADTKIHLIEALPRLLTMYDEDLSEYTRKILEEKGVTVHLNSPVKELHEHQLVFEDHTIDAATIIWAAGVEAPAITRTLGTETDRGGRLMVQKDLSLPGHREVFAIGDIAHCIDIAEVRVPGLSPAAMQMGRHVAKVILKEMKGEATSGSYPVRPGFKYFDKGSMATIGRSAAVASAGKLKFTGFIAWIMWLVVHLAFLIGFRNRIAVLLQWFYSYLRYRRGARIITGVETPGNDNPT